MFIQYRVIAVCLRGTCRYWHATSTNGVPPNLVQFIHLLSSMQIGLGCIVGLYVYYAALFWRHGPRQCIPHWQPLQPHHRPKIAMVRRMLTPWTAPKVY
jgi:hypothetical protein